MSEDEEVNHIILKDDGAQAIMVLNNKSENMLEIEQFAFTPSEALKLRDFITRNFEKEGRPKCEGHYDDDFTLVSGVGIGEPTFCDGRCLPPVGKDCTEKNPCGNCSLCTTFVNM